MSMETHERTPSSPDGQEQNTFPGHTLPEMAGKDTQTAGKDTHIVYDDKTDDIHVIAIDPLHKRDRNSLIVNNDCPNGKVDTENEIKNDHKDEHHFGRITGFIYKIQTQVHGFFEVHGQTIKRIIYLLLLIGYLVYFGFAIWYSLDGAFVLINLTAFILFVLLCRIVNHFWGAKIRNCVCKPCTICFARRGWRFAKWTIYILLILGIIVFLVVDVGADTHRLTSAAGMVIILLVAFITSKHPARVRWRPVIWGIGLQVVLGVIILRWSYGYHFFKFMGDQVKVFLEYADKGSEFVFGPKFIDHPMAFKVFPIVIFFSAVINIFYYWGLMQFIVCKIAWLMQFTMDTTAIESLNAATNIFIGMAESCIILRPFLHKLTKSELHAVMTGGFATVAGSYIALLVEVGAQPEHLLSAAIMSAPAALAMAKLSYPETEESHTKTEKDVYMEKTPARNIMEAASNGAMDAIKVVASVAANLIAILGLIHFLNATLSYLGGRVGYPELSFQVVCSVVFWPVSTIMGIDIADAGKVASLLGTKIFVDEFISFTELGEMGDQIGERSRVIATYACCGFGSIAAVGIYIGALASVAPERKGDISEVALRAVVNGNLAGFMTACIAGVLYTGQSLIGPAITMAPTNQTIIEMVPLMTNSSLVDLIPT